MVRKRKKNKPGEGRGEATANAAADAADGAADGAASSDGAEAGELDEFARDEADEAATPDGDDDDPEPDDAPRDAEQDPDEAGVPGSAGPPQRGPAADEEGGGAATQLGSTRFVIFGFFAAWLVGSYVAHKALEGIWGSLGHREWFTRALPTVAAVPYEGELVSRASVSFVLGAILAAVIVFIYYRKPDVRQWSDEVAEQVSKVKWPTRKEVGNYTIVTIAVGAVLAAYLAILDRFWGFLTNLFYSSGL